MDSNEKNLDNSLEGAVNMTQEEIERFLAEQESLGSEPGGFDDTDLAGLLSGLDSTADDDMQEISALLNRADKNEAVADDVVALMNQQEAEGETAYDAMDLFSGEETQKKEGFFRKLINKYKQGKKEKQEEKEQKKREKQALKEQKKREKQAQKENKGQEEQQQDLEKGHEAASDDNMSEALALLGIDEELNQTSQGASGDAVKEKSAKKKKEKKAQKPKKEKKVKEKKPKDKKVKDKKVKDKKPKNEKIREKEVIEVSEEFLDEVLDEAPNKKKIIMVFVACIMIMLGFLVVNYHITEHSDKKLAEEAYEAEDYLECYKLLYGKKLDDAQKEMFHRSEMTLRMNIFWGHYHDDIAEQKWLEGLDKLVQFVYGYPELSEYAMEKKCQDIVDATYNDVLNILSEDYKVSEQEVLDIAMLWKDFDYTQALADLVEEMQKKYQDMLPEEQDRITQK